MSDWRETKDTQDQDSGSGARGERLSPRGIGAMQGELGGTEPTDSADDLITIHPHSNPETLPSPEVEPITIKNPEGQGEDGEGEDEDEEGKITTPEGFHPGGPEGGW